MPTGFPDWQVPINISAQELEEIINRPKYGSAQIAAGSKQLTPFGTATLVSIAGTGMIYGGYIYCSGASSQRNDIPFIEIDGVALSIVDLTNLQKRGTDEKYTDLLYLKKFDDIIFDYTVSLVYGITFETSVTLKWGELAGATPTAFGRLYYALI